MARRLEINVPNLYAPFVKEILEDKSQYDLGITIIIFL